MSAYVVFLLYSISMDAGIIQKLKRYFEKRDEVVMAFLFGSRYKGTARQSSDWDIGVLLSSTSSEVEREIWDGIEEICKTSVDMVVLNRAPAHIAWSIVRGESLVIKDRKIYLDFLIRASHEANDWYRTTEDYHRVFERSKSLSREDRARLEKAVQFLEVELSDFASFEKMTWIEYQGNRTKKRNIERWAEQVINSVIDVAEIILASEKKVIPESYKEIVKNLALVSPFGEGDTCAALSGWTSLRNELAHEYLDYRWDKLSFFLQGAKRPLDDFKEKVKVFLALPNFTHL